MDVLDADTNQWIAGDAVKVRSIAWVWVQDDRPTDVRTDETTA